MRNIQIVAIVTVLFFSNFGTLFAQEIVNQGEIIATPPLNNPQEVIPNNPPVLNLPSPSDITPPVTNEVVITPAQETPQVMGTPVVESQIPQNQNPTSPLEVSTADAIDQIQKTLLFSDREAAQRRSVERKSSLDINHTKKSEESLVEIKVENNQISKIKQQINQKQTLAYNASIAGQYEVAVELYKQILKSDPNNHYASFALATCYHKLGQYRQAKSIYYQLLKHKWSDQSTQDELINNLIEVVVEESPNEAIYLLKKISIQNPNSPRILSAMAMAYDKINKSDQSVLFLKRAINLDPKEVRYKFNLAIIYDKTQDYEEALKYYQQVMNEYLLGNDPDNSLPIEQVKQRIDFIKQEFPV